MVRIEAAPNADAVRRAARHTIFVEGASPATLDPLVLEGLLEDTGIRVRPLGPSMSVRAAAEAMHPHHPDYYFLIDRDHYDDTFVEQTWANFPDVATHNLIIWRRRELENYFVIPEFLGGSPFLKCDGGVLRKTIVDTAQRNLFWDAANVAIIGVREAIKQKWIDSFASVRECDSRSGTLARIRALKAFATKARSVSQLLQIDRVCNRFESAVDELSGGGDTLEFGQGTWLEMLRGKFILPTVINRCFHVVDSGGRSLQGVDRLREVARSLLRRPLHEQPTDFQQLHQLIADRIRTT